MTQTCPVCQSTIEDGASVCPVCMFKLSGATQEFSPVGRVPAQDPTDVPSRTQSYLRMVRGPQVGAMYPLEGDLVTIGRNPNSTIFLNDMTVSREHAEVSRVADALVIKDMHSFNGVWVNNRTVDMHAMRPGDYIQIGKYDFIYEEKTSE